MDQLNVGCNTCASDTTPCAITPNLGNGNSFGGYTYGTACNPAGGADLSTQNVLLPNNGEYYPEKYLNLFSGKTIPLFKAYTQSYPAIAQLLFDYDSLYDPANIGMTPQHALVYKSFPTAEMQLAGDGKRFLWSEWKYEEPDVYIAKDEAVATNVILLANSAGNPFTMADCDLRTKEMFMPGDTILVFSNSPDASPTPDCCAKLEERTITAINPAFSWNAKTRIQLTLETGTLPGVIVKGFNASPNAVLPQFNLDGVTYPGDRVKKLYHGRNDCDGILNGFQQTPTKFKYSYIQHIGFKMLMDKTTLNRMYADEEGVDAVIKSRIFGLQTEMVKQVARAFYFGRNRSPDTGIALSGVTNPDGSTRYLPSETLGVFPALYAAALAKPHLKLITSAARLQTDEDFVRHLLDQILEAQNARVLAAGTPITLVMDRAATSKFLKLNNAWNKFTGITVFKNDNVKKDFTLAAIQTPNGPVEIMTCYELGNITGNTGTILILPKSHVLLKSRTNHKYDLGTGTIEKSTHGFYFKDITLEQLNGHECRVYNAFTEFSIVLGMVDSGAWRLIGGFR